ncbi:hypothetical protein E4633_08860 [Geomonas terrae]|uniref:Lipoprotein n=1 Tax=Geomonas terrae TaxID=2562681 RepID=A0A4S1CFW9_9BACT|nr:hypothetical protein [Geomonas terrae]TGU72409.1 hypothetical protein E4633_08860 [Geomonas terrae]
MFFSRFLVGVLAFGTIFMSGCTITTTLPTISDDLKPQARLEGKAHLLPIRDNSQTGTTDGKYATESGYAETRYMSTNRAADVLQESTAKCLTQAGMTVTQGANIPEDADYVLVSDFRRLYIGTSHPLWLYNVALAATTRIISSSETPWSAITIGSMFQDRKTQAKTPLIFSGEENSLHHFTKRGGAERSFRLVQENYCGWLQKKIAEFKTNPQLSKENNEKELQAFKTK